MWVQNSFHQHNQEQGNHEGVAASGTLYLVGTPIGNLQDMTYRAVETLKTVDMIAAEDTRQTRKLLTHFDIHTRLMSYHEHNQKESGSKIIRMLIEGKNIALVSDAGLPAISDPGMDLVAEAVLNNIHVVPIPGANAALTALIASGLSTETFVFAGFLPRDKKGCQQKLAQMKGYQATLIFYEAPHRLIKTLEIIYDVLGNRNMTLARELTKKHESFLRGNVREITTYLQNMSNIRGECCLIIEGNRGGFVEKDSQDQENEVWWSDLSLTEHVDHYVNQGETVKDAIKKVAVDRNIARRSVYNEYHDPSKP